MAKTAENPHTEVKAKPQNARMTALMAVHQILEKGAFANLTLEKSLTSEIIPEDRRLITEIVNGTVRMKGYLDWALALFVSKKLEKLNPWLRNILRISAYQILFMDRIPDHAAVSEAVKLTRKKVSEGLTGFCNGVLRSLIREKAQLPEKLQNLKDENTRLAVQYSLEPWMIGELRENIPADLLEDVLNYYNTPGLVDLRVNLLKTTPEALSEELRQKGIETEKGFVPSTLKTGRHNENLTYLAAFKKGKFYIQNQASQIAAYLAAPKAGDRVLDLCCGIGGKSTHLAEISKDQAKITAVELYAHKLALLLENAERLGLKSIMPLKADLSQGLAGRYEAAADVVLLDVPCSGWGVLNRRADMRWNQSKEELSSLQELQQTLLNEAGKLVKPGGKLLYSTCTLRQAENEEHIQKFLADHPQFKPLDLSEALAFFPLNAEDAAAAHSGMLTILPGLYGTDGMFYALLGKEG